MGCCFQQKTCNISETGRDRTKVTTDDQQEVAYALSVSATVNDRFNDVDYNTAVRHLLLILTAASRGLLLHMSK